jgi:hypothetical protein
MVAILKKNVGSFIIGPKGIDVAGVMHDFEWALVNSIEKWFKCEYHLGCFFHWKQAIRHNLVEWKFERDDIKIMLPMFEFLTVIKKEDMRKGVDYIREMVRKTKGIKKSEKKRFEEFMKTYFIPTWLKPKLIEMFNYNSDEKGDWRREM